MTRDIGYIAQRSNDPNKVLAFLNALPPGTLESGAATIPDKEIMKRFKLRSPKMTKALLALGVDEQVVSSYYAAFNKAEEVPIYFFHKSLFPDDFIMHLQGDSIHYTSCMKSGKGTVDGKRGSYYEDCIDEELEAYNAGDLGMIVAGNPAANYSGIPRDLDGFKARAKVRAMYLSHIRKAGSANHISSRSDEPVAFLVDRVYGNESLLIPALQKLHEWVKVNYPKAVVLLRDFMNKRLRHETTKWKLANLMPAIQRFMSYHHNLVVACPANKTCLNNRYDKRTLRFLFGALILDVTASPYFIFGARPFITLYIQVKSSNEENFLYAIDITPTGIEKELLGACTQEEKLHIEKLMSSGIVRELQALVLFLCKLSNEDECELMKFRVRSKQQLNKLVDNFHLSYTHRKKHNDPITNASLVPTLNDLPRF